MTRAIAFVLVLIFGVAFGSETDEVRIKRAIENAIAQRSDLAESVAWEVVTPLPKLPARCDSIVVKPFDIPSSGNYTLWLQCYNRSALGRAVAVKIQAVRTGKIIRVTRKLKPGDPLQNAFQVIEAQLPSNRKMVTEAEAGNVVANRSMNPGDVVEVGWVREQPAVHRNDPVVLITESGALSVEVEGTALMAGKIGDRIAVKTSLGTRSQWGIVESAQRVRVR